MRFRANTTSTRRPRGLRRTAFTLIEVAIAIVIVGVAVVAVSSMVAASTRSTAINDEIQTATMLARAMHERCLNLDHASLVALDNTEYSPPIDSQAQVLTDLAGYKQHVDVDNVDPTQLNGAVSPTDTGLLRVTVTVFHHNQSVWSTSRLLATTKQN